MTGYLELATRCEQATGPDRELDGDIATAIGWQDVRRESYGFVRGVCPAKGKRQQVYRYTASLDAAMTLAVQGISAPDVLRKAIERCSRYGAPTFIEALPRFVTGEWLRARHAQEPSNG